MNLPDQIKRETSKLKLAALELAPDYKHIRADAFFVGIASMSENDQNLVVSVFENQIVPALSETGEVGARFVRNAVATIVADVPTTRELHAALSAALEDIDRAEQTSQTEFTEPRGQ